MSFEFLLTSLVVVLLPGTGVLYTVAVGLGQGFKASVAAALGCTLGILPAATASIIGLAALLHTSAMVFHTIKYLGAAYLFYMAWRVLQDRTMMKVRDTAQGASHTRILTTATLLNILNPKLSLFFLAFLPQFIALSAPDATAALVGLATVFMGMTFAVFVLYGACASLARDYVIHRPSVMKWIKRSFAGTFGFLGAKLALST
ncbi:LysE family translocator [Litorivita pollutaquae]|uniref:LysE family translocator n=1 Tax=Litorivita pollutaquae TaxID=2200892 RepID=A0A2V4NQ68_9RHOB|nr:LysE family translocator [Litorivita pollutaquae]PYC46796.1 LysE family translocator [Litorivita pollutaquae]